MNSTTLLINKLRDLGAILRPPTTPSSIADVQRRLGCSFPQGVSEFYNSCDGTIGATTEHLWDFFSLEQVLDRTQTRRAAFTQFTTYDGEIIHFGDLLCFCDVLIDAPTYMFCGNPDDRRFGFFYADQGGQGWFVADSFDAFVQVFVAENSEILLNTNG